MTTVCEPRSQHWRGFPRETPPPLRCTLPGLSPRVTARGEVKGSAADARCAHISGAAQHTPIRLSRARSQPTVHGRGRSHARAIEHANSSKARSLPGRVPLPLLRGFAAPMGFAHQGRDRGAAPSAQSAVPLAKPAAAIEERPWSTSRESAFRGQTGLCAPWKARLQLADDAREACRVQRPQPEDRCAGPAYARDACSSLALRGERAAAVLAYAAFFPGDVPKPRGDLRRPYRRLGVSAPHFAASSNRSRVWVSASGGSCPPTTTDIPRAFIRSSNAS